MLSPEATKPKQTQINTVLMRVLVISFVVHVLVGVVIGGITVVKYVIPDDAEFEAPEEQVVEEQPQEVKVMIKPKQAEIKPSPLALKSVKDIAVAPISVDLPSMGDSFTVSGGLGGSGGGRMSFGGVGGDPITRFPDIKGFGTTDKTEHAWEGTVYLFDEGKISSLRDGQGKWFTRYSGENRGDRQSQKIYNYSFNMPSQDFTKGFPGVTDQFEWFAIDFELQLHWPLELVGEYEFRLNSDDGSILEIDSDIVIDNDGKHAMTEVTGTHKMKTGRRRFRLAYFQGPKTGVGLILEYRKVGESDWRVFDTKELIKYQL
jgi:hypothetical protein